MSCDLLDLDCLKLGKQSPVFGMPCFHHAWAKLFEAIFWLLRWIGRGLWGLHSCAVWMFCESLGLWLSYTGIEQVLACKGLLFGTG